MGGEKWFRGIETAAEDVAAHAIVQRLAVSIAQHPSLRVEGAEAVLLAHEFLWKTCGFEVGEVVTVPKPYSHRLAGSELLEESGRP